MGETRQKKPSKRTVKASPRKSKANASLMLSGDSQTPSNVGGIVGDHVSEPIVPPLDGGESVELRRQLANSSLIGIRITTGKGIGVFAARKIPTGTLVVAEAPVIRLTRSQESSSDGDDEHLKEVSIRRQYTALSTFSRKGYDKLFDTEKPHFSRSKSIFYSNCYNMEQYSEHGGACIGLLASRINHSCSNHNLQFSFADNAYLDTTIDEVLADESDSANSTSSDSKSPRSSGLMLMYAIKDIPKGKELLSNYLSPYLVSQARQNELQMHYKFTCDCSACSQQGFWADSDQRRSLMRRYKTSVERCEAVLQAHARAPRLSDELKTETSGISILQEATSAIDALSKLLNLLIKEGQNGYDLVKVYHDLAKWSFRNRDSGAGKSWAAKERATSVICFGLGSRQVADIDSRSEGWWEVIN